MYIKDFIFFSEWIWFYISQNSHLHNLYLFRIHHLFINAGSPSLFFVFSSIDTGHHVTDHDESFLGQRLVSLGQHPLSSVRNSTQNLLLHIRWRNELINEVEHPRYLRIHFYDKQFRSTFIKCPLHANHYTTYPENKNQ